MEKLNLKDAVAFGNSAFTRLDRAEALYEELVERLYAPHSVKALQIASNHRNAWPMLSSKQHKRKSDDAMVSDLQKRP